MGYEVDFLPVGDGARSGDAIIVRFGDLHGQRQAQKVIVIDGGYQDDGDEIVDHLDKYYKTDVVDLVVSTHPDCDHANGLEVVLSELHVGGLLMHLPWTNTSGISDFFKSSRVTDASVRDHLRKSLDNTKTLEGIATSRGIRIVQPFAGLTLLGGAFQVLGPSQAYYQQLLSDFRGLPEAKEGFLQKAVDRVARFVEETLHLETLSDDDDTSAENNSSVISLLTVEDGSMLFTGDAGKEALTNAAQVLDAQGFDYSSLRFVQIPHHGSRRNVGPTVLNKLLGQKTGTGVTTRTAFVSAAKEGEPKHPSRRVTNAFHRRGFAVHATRGSSKRHSKGAPERGWGRSEPLPFFDEVEALD
jgi:beta-lactamase superfamily II metal-dependent hydrolase